MSANPGRALGYGVWLAGLVGMMTKGAAERRTHFNARAQFETARAELEHTLRRIYGSEWPHGFDEVIARIVRTRVREAHGLPAPGVSRQF
jgi:hypothetical protein